MISRLLLTAFIAGFFPTMGSAAICDRLWASSTPTQIGATLLWAEGIGAFTPRRDVIETAPLGIAILEYVQATCPDEFRQMGLGGEQYIAHMLGLNFVDGNGAVPRRIPHTAFMNRLAGPGIVLGLPLLLLVAPAAPASTAVAQPRAPRVVRHTVVPGCPSCSTAASN